MQTLFIERGSPWENGYVESFNGKPCDELLARRGWVHKYIQAASGVSRPVLGILCAGPQPIAVRLVETALWSRDANHVDLS